MSADRELATVWIDIDNPPQVQYLVPVHDELLRRGHAVVLTARDNSITHQLLRDLETEFRPVGGVFGKQPWKKIIGVLGRALHLVRAVHPERPRLAIAASRSAALAAWMLRIPCFIVCDYEHAELTSYTKLGSHVISPEIIPTEVLQARGFAADRVHSFPGLKENLTFHGKDLEGYAPFEVPEPERVVVAFRPPASETHYYSPRSKAIYEALLEYLATRDDTYVIFLPRYKWQVEDLKRLDWKGPWLAPEKPIPAISLLKCSDMVISSGGTMLREACYLGIPAYSIFQSEIGEVDKHLAGLDKLVLIKSPAEFARLSFRKKTPDSFVAGSGETMDCLLNCVFTASGLASDGKDKS